LKIQRLKSKKEGIPLDQQSLICVDKHLGDGYTLEYYHNKKELALHLFT
jgi:hypothetical protein